ncbi:MAG: hypothetical protein DRN53_08265 [Thermoprotei archaeon]|nr:MAG: hypothetical protein DRN53_08265 [Thermoprotei archaeon]
MPKFHGKAKKIIVFIICLLVFTSLIILIKPFLDIHSILILGVLHFLNETARYVAAIYWGNSEYLWTSILLSVEVYFFSFILVNLVSGRNLKGASSESRSTSSRILYLLSILVRHFITLIHDIRRTYVYAFMNKRVLSRNVDLSYYYLLTWLILGIILSILIIISYEYSHTLMWSIFLVFLFITASILIVVSSVEVLEEEFKKTVGISCKGGEEIVVRDGNVVLRIKGRLIALGLSVGTGIAGIITTLGAIIIKPSLAFTIIPATFDMLSLISALTEFTGLRRIRESLSNLRSLGIGLLNLLPTISWSIYTGGIICLIFHELKWTPSVDLILTIIASIWILISVLSGTFPTHFKYSIQSITKRIILFLLPFFLLLTAIP